MLGLDSSLIRANPIVPVPSDWHHCELQGTHRATVAK
jgi:hypothetical protein